MSPKRQRRKGRQQSRQQQRCVVVLGVLVRQCDAAELGWHAPQSLRGHVHAMLRAAVHGLHDSAAPSFGPLLAWARRHKGLAELLAEHYFRHTVLHGRSFLRASDGVFDAAALAQLLAEDLPQLRALLHDDALLCRAAVTGGRLLWERSCVYDADVATFCTIAKEVRWAYRLISAHGERTHQNTNQIQQSGI